MTRLRVGTRGSDLALRQTRWVCDLLQAVHAGVELEEVVIKTHGDIATGQPLDTDFPVGGFVSAIEQALLDGRIDFAVHSYKDLPTAATAGLMIAAVPTREAPHDVLVTRDPVDLSNLPRGIRLGTSSPRRAAQMRRQGAVEIVPVRGNVPTRVAKVESGELDGVVLAAAGLKRLGLRPPNLIDLPLDWFVPAPAQGALAVQVREGDAIAALLAPIEHRPSRSAVETERSFLRNLHAGCHTPVGALAMVFDGTISLRGQLFSDDGSRMVEGGEIGDDPHTIGARLAENLARKLQESQSVPRP
jgi:hydroxymethylbilane synthase